jgi:hypothetical protein
VEDEADEKSKEELIDIVPDRRCRILRVVLVRRW